MPSRSRNNIDWIILSIYLALVFIGWTMIYTVGYGEGYAGGFFAFLDNPVGKQLIWVLISLAVLFISFSIDAKFWRTFANIIYVSCLVLLVAVLIFGKTIKGATSWFDFGGGITLQPSEFAKFGTMVALASYLSAYANNLKTLKSKLYAISFLLAPMLLILLQPDAGSTLVFLSFFIVLYREGFSGNVFVVGLSAAAILAAGLVNPPPLVVLALAAIGAFFLIWNTNKRLYWFAGFILLVTAGIIGVKNEQTNLILASALSILTGLCVFQWVKKKQRLVSLVAGAVVIGSVLAIASNFAYEHILKRHQQERILVWLKPSEADPQGAAYNLNHSKMAIASGGLSGKGFLEGSFTQGNFVPEQITDFIFCAVGEEQGFIGTIFILSLFLGMMWRIIVVAERQRSDFNRLYAYGVASVLFIHFFINIGMTMGLMPIIGIPLPFLSKGGSSLLVFSIMIGVLLKLDAQRT
ncbi:MAG: rod shape-determining protein RodA [Bacteroidetes bacterium]|nr:rod shape-determining protein RodA [Bacteroidota bacterium]